MTSSIKAQTPQADPASKVQRGHALYKRTKIYDSKTGATATKPERVADDAIGRAAYEFEKLKNPYTNSLPADIRNRELEFTQRIPEGDDFQKSLSSHSGRSSHKFSNWKNRGPFNVGGRTRALALDATNEQVILAGGVSGGLWRSENGGASWVKVTRRDQSPSITCIVQDTTSKDKLTWYYGTGEVRGNSASAGGAFYGGSGVFKSVDGGRTWNVLEATSDNDPGTLSPFDMINSIAVNPTNGDLYVATYNGVHRSQDGGNTFEEVISSGSDNWTEVMITPTGQLYATVESGTDSSSGFFTSTDGKTWTNITPPNFISFYVRTVMAFDPSNDNVIYFLTDGVSTATLYRYDAAAPSPMESWTDLSENLPTNIGGAIGDLNFQGFYNMLVKVHPDNPKLIFVGGTNLYRSTTGFTTPAGQESWIGGYSPLNDVSLYTDHHPDQHAMVFYPSDPNKVLSGNDGGVFVTEDIKATDAGVEPVDWVSLNNGYITTQPYKVSFDPEANNDDLLAGFQDNGTWSTSSIDPMEPWVSEFGGDGADNAIADGGLTKYLSSQNGNIFRFNFSADGTFETFARVTPERANGFAFIAPFLLDHNNDNIMYLPSGNRIWRNNNLDELPTMTNARPSKNWVELINTAVSSQITALDVSKYPVANRLYYGTANGDIYRMDNANLDNQEVINISEGKDLPPGFVNDINVDLSNPDRVIVTFSNYGIPSIFLTEDGGKTWTNISGNLEENADGTGNGPSVRSTAFFGASTGIVGDRFQRVFAATSSGLYYTNRLSGENTRWRKERVRIGNAVTDEVKTRKDGFVALSAHGNGLFSARFPLINKFPESTLMVTSLLEDLSLPISSPDTTLDVSGLFTQTAGLPIEIELTNSNPEFVTATLSDNELSLSIAPGKAGEATIGLLASSNGEQVAEGFTIKVLEPSIYAQDKPEVNRFPSQNFLDFGALVQAADDFTVPTGNRWQINRILAPGSGRGFVNIFDDVTVIIYADLEGKPGEEIYNSGSLVPVTPASIDLNLQLPETVVLETGTYWLSVYVNLAFNPGGMQWFWRSQVNETGQESHYKDPQELFRSVPDWTPASEVFDRGTVGQLFQLFGDIEDLSASAMREAAQDVSLTALDTQLKSVAWPNPSSGSFNFNFEALNMGSEVAVQIVDFSGKQVHSEEHVHVSSLYVWDALEVSAGFYLVKVNGAGSQKSFKIVKK